MSVGHCTAAADLDHFLIFCFCFLFAGKKMNDNARVLKHLIITALNWVLGPVSRYFR